MLKNTLFLALFLCVMNAPLIGQAFDFTHRFLPANSDCCVISLGANCINSTWFKQLNIRFQAFPFDWVECHEIEGLTELIAHDFKDYLLLENLVPHYHSYYNRIRDKLYKINFVHDFSFQGNAEFSFDRTTDRARGISCLHQEYRQVYSKYQRRIARFRDVIKNYKNVFFVRTMHVNKQSAFHLYDALISLFGDHAGVWLIVISDDPEFQQDWNHHKIKNFYMPYNYITTDEHTHQFAQILHNLLAIC